MIDRAAYYPGKDLFLNKGYYKSFWWGLRLDGGQCDFVAQGRFGQIVYVSLQAEVIILRNGEREIVEDGEFLMCQFATAMWESLQKS